ncbi:MAG: hypothetical protein QGF32_06550 [Candidatus Thalassarchaeaceae archaeon]|jgi:hypothetical protein|nr:hypothetical protein [Candidatus Thalassarchaeaceae archaeon]
MIVRGIAIWPSLSEPNPTFGDFETKLRIDAETKDLILPKLEAAHEENHADQMRKLGKKELKKYPIYCEAEVDDDGNPTGSYLIKLKMKAKDKEGRDRRLKIVDAKKNLMDEPVGMGSEIVASFGVYGWYAPQLGAGITLQLKAVQVIKLIERGGGGTDEFDVEDGFESAATTVCSTDTSDIQDATGF